MIDAIPSDIAELAACSGVATSFYDQSGNYVEVDLETVVKVLAALGVDASDPNALSNAQLRSWREVTPPVVVVKAGEVGRIPVHIPDGSVVTGWLRTEDGNNIELFNMEWWVDPRVVDGVLVGEASLGVPDTVPLGWHSARIECELGSFLTTVVVVPRALAVDERRRWGVMTQLYATRSRTSSGIGDLHDLATIAQWSGERGADFVLVNPLHAAEPTTPIEESPYLPATRRFVNPLYLRVQDIPEYAELPAHMRNTIDRSLENLTRLNSSPGLLQRDTVWTAKRLALELVFEAGLSAHRTHEFDAYVASEGQGLEDFATWCAIVDAHGQEPSAWPNGLRTVHGSSVPTFRVQAARDIRFHQWMQWQLDAQLARAQAVAREAGMSIGIMADLAVGVHPDGADSWSLNSVLAHNVSVGAPPDMYNQLGQNWSQPPWRPDALRDAAYVPYRDMLRTMLRHVGAVRIDHILGLFRLWWIPDGQSAAKGTYVSFDHDAMLGILLLEAERAHAIVVGEDLGTVPDVVEHALAERGILGTIISWFERWDDGSLRRPEHWRTNALSSIWVHDLPPTMGYLGAEHVHIRAQLDLLTSDADVELARAEAERGEWIRACIESGWLAEEDAWDMQAVMVALYGMCASSPARLFGVGINDLVADVRAQNQPGTHREYPNWSVPMCDGDQNAVTLEDIESYSLAGRVLDAVSRARPQSP